VTEQEMQIRIIERQKQIELEEKEILRREKQYDSEVKKKADADRYAVEQNAAAEKMRELAQADAEKYRIESLAQAEAEKIRMDKEKQRQILFAFVVLRKLKLNVKLPKPLNIMVKQLYWIWLYA